MDIIWKLLSFLPDLNVVDYILIGVLGLLSLILISAGIFAFVKDKPVKTVVLTLLGGISLAFAFLFSKHSKKDSDEIEERIEELKKKEQEILEEINQLDKEAKQGYKEYEKLMKEKEKIEKELKEKLKENEQIKPKPVETDQDVLDSFDSAANYSKNKKE